MKVHKSSTQTVGRPCCSTKSEALCFDKNEFMKETFSIDEFLHKNRSAPSLELLRDNLGIYLKGLRASMIDLINEDYADFVSLSANLVGLDQSIDTIAKPLHQFRKEIYSIKVLIEENEINIRDRLEQKRQLRDLKRNLQSLRKVYDALTKLGSLVDNQLRDNEIRSVDLERAALELIQLKFNENFCTDYLSQQQKDKIFKLNNDILEKLRSFFIESLKAATSSCSENLERSLRIYVTLGECKMAELVFREDVVAPYMRTVISEHALQNSHQGLAGIYSKILNFISLHMTDVLRLTHYTDNIRGVNFLVNSFWADVEMRLETHMSSIFAPGNSEIFYGKYKCTKDFLTKIENLLANDDAIREFREHKQTKSFQARWNLPVYFQICFQEIAGKFESTLEPLMHKNIMETTTCAAMYHLRPFNSAWNCIERCWEDEVFLVEVFPKFYKLTLQIILRLSRWIKDVLKNIEGHNINYLVTLHVDISKFANNFPKIQDRILKTISRDMREHNMFTDTFNKSFEDLLYIYKDLLCTIQKALVNILINESGLENIRQVNDLPRLYRKTNRDIPSRPSLYVEQMLRPLKAFSEQESPRLGSEVVNDVLMQVFQKITFDYYLAVSDVLNSVQKTEESLRRLRNLKSASGAASPSSAPSKITSDDDKIRLQLRVDVITWTEGLANLNFMPTQIDKITDLNNIVEESIKVKDTQKKVK